MHKPYKVLVVEDDVDCAAVASKALKDHGFMCSVAGTASRCRELLCEDCFDLILLDLMLPDDNGHDLLRRIRKFGIKTPVIITSAVTDIESKLKGFQNRADDYLTKPFDPKELICRVCVQIRHCEARS